MATLEKLVRTVEALKLHQNPSSVSLDETMSKKDKIAHCVSVTDLVCSQGGKNSPEAAKCLVMAIEMFFTLLDDQDADIRMVADENLNRMTRSLGESNIGRLQVSQESEESRVYEEVRLIGDFLRSSSTRKSKRTGAPGACGPQCPGSPGWPSTSAPPSVDHTSSTCCRVWRPWP